MAGFRPLIRGFFFYTQKKHCFPHFTTGGFRPLIRGFFFYKHLNLVLVHAEQGNVSVPSFGDSFFINAAAFMFDGNGGKFPSPHSGILFL